MTCVLQVAAVQQEEAGCFTSLFCQHSLLCSTIICCGGHPDDAHHSEETGKGLTFCAQLQARHLLVLLGVQVQLVTIEMYWLHLN